MDKCREGGIYSNGVLVNPKYKQNINLKQPVSGLPEISSRKYIMEITALTDWLTDTALDLSTK